MGYVDARHASCDNCHREISTLHFYQRYDSSKGWTRELCPVCVIPDAGQLIEHLNLQSLYVSASENQNQGETETMISRSATILKTVAFDEVVMPLPVSIVSVTLETRSFPDKPDRQQYLAVFTPQTPDGNDCLWINPGNLDELCRAWGRDETKFAGKSASLIQGDAGKYQAVCIKPEAETKGNKKSAKR